MAPAMPEAARVETPAARAGEGASSVDIAIVGAGPAGLCFARALVGTGLRVVVIERQSESDLAGPPFDGREIALTHRSVRLLTQLDIWGRIPADEISPLRHARILDGASPHAVRVDHRDTGRDTLGYLVPNHLIRRHAYAAARDAAALTLRAGTQVLGIETDEQRAHLRLSDGSTLDARLVVAADSRFSQMRRAMGIGARMHDFGRSMLVCRLSHEIDHGHTAWEWFDHGQTLAMLPLQGKRCSVVLTLPQREMDAVVRLDDDAFARDMTRRLQGRLGTMTAPGTRHVYPLVGVYPDRFVARRFALIGDSAVGMHPVTAHGFNFGLRGQETLTQLIAATLAQGADIGALDLLDRYDRAHRRDTLPLYLATRGIVGLFTDERPPARLARKILLRAASLASPFTRALARVLADDGAAIARP